MKYLRYLAIIIFKIVSKVVGLLWYYIAVPFRGYSRNVVYNYVLQNNIYLPRLLERNPKLENGYYEFENIRDTFFSGKLKYRKIRKIEYILVLWLLWIWVDDDSNYDTYDEKREYDYNNYGNAFDLGDSRTITPLFDFKLSSLWNIRNTAYNFNYMFEEIAENNKYNFYVRFTNKYIDWHFGYIPYSNKKRKGRLVFFSEDITKID